MSENKMTIGQRLKAGFAAYKAGQAERAAEREAQARRDLLEQAMRYAPYLADQNLQARSFQMSCATNEVRYINYSDNPGRTQLLTPHAYGLASTNVRWDSAGFEVEGTSTRSRKIPWSAVKEPELSEPNDFFREGGMTGRFCALPFSYEGVRATFRVKAPPGFNGKTLVHGHIALYAYAASVKDGSGLDADNLNARIKLLYQSIHGLS